MPLIQAASSECVRATTCHQSALPQDLLEAQVGAVREDLLSGTEPRAQGGPPFAAMNASSRMDETMKAPLETVGVDARAAYFILVMSGIAAGTGILGTSILMLATCRSRRYLPKEYREPSVMGAPASPQDVRLAMPLEPVRRRPVTICRRRAQVFGAFFGTFGLCIAVVSDGIISNTLSKDTGLKWESYTLLFSAGCCWMLCQAGVLAIQLEPGRGYSRTSFGEAMLSGIAPFITDSFDTLRDTVFGGLCFTSKKGGLHVLGGISWAYLFVFHCCLIFHSHPRFLVELFRNHMSVFVLPTRDLKSAPVRLSCAAKVLAQIGKQLARTKRRLLLMENIPQAGFGVIYLAVEGGSLVVALLNLATPALQVLVSPRVQKRLARWYAQRLDAAIDDGDEVLVCHLCSEMGAGGKELLDEVVLLSKHLRAILTSRAQKRTDRGDIIVDGDLGSLIEYGSQLNLRGAGLGGQQMLLKAVTAFAVSTVWVDTLALDDNNLTDDDAVAVAPVIATRGAHISGLQELCLSGNRIGDAGAWALAENLAECRVLSLLMVGNLLSEEAKEAVRKACRKHRIDLEL